MSARSRPTSDRPCSIAFATSCGAKRAGPTQPIWTGWSSSRRSSPLEEAIGREAVERTSARAALKPEEREAIIGRIEMGYSYEELAQVLGKPTAEAARKAAQRALVRLAEEMKRVAG